MSAKVLVKQLICHETNEWLGDECRLIFTVDGLQALTLQKDMDEDEAWTINKEFIFDNEVTVRLVEKDQPPVDPDDDLGQLSIAASSSGHGSGQFTGDDALYNLVWEVSEVQPDPPSTNNNPGQPNGGTPQGLGNVEFRKIREPLFNNVIGFTVLLDHQAVQTLQNSSASATTILAAAGATGPAISVVILATAAIVAADRLTGNGARIDHVFLTVTTTVLPR